MIDLGVEKYINLNCSQYSFYECVGTKISMSDLSNCSVACMPLTFPNVSYPLCQKFEYWYVEYDGDNCTECDCNWKIVNEILKNIEINYECPRSCSTIQYHIIYDEDYKNNEHTDYAVIQYKLSMPLIIQTNKEFIISDVIGMIGSVGGTLGLFIGFSFSNVLTIMMEYLQLVIDKICSRLTKPTHVKRFTHNEVLTYDEKLDNNTKSVASLKLLMQQEKDRLTKVEKELAKVVMQLTEFKNGHQRSQNERRY